MKDVYRELCEKEPSIPIFSQAWWLDAVAGDSWDVVLVTKGEQVLGSLPYLRKTRFGFTLLMQPKLTQTLGPWIRPTQKSYPKALAHQKDVLGALADQLPEYDYYSQNWHCSQLNWLPFYWRGFEQSTVYTYRLELGKTPEELWKGLQENTRREVRKARDRFSIVVRPASLAEFLILNRMTFERQQRSMPYPEEFVSGIDVAASARNARDCLVAVDQEGRLHAGVYIVRSGDSAYYLMGGGDPELRSSGATSLVLWEAILRQPESVKVFDFEGSMIEPVERFFRAFGAQQVPYFAVSHTSSKILKAALCLRDLVRH